VTISSKSKGARGEAAEREELVRAARLVEKWSGIALPADRLWVLESELSRLSPDGTLASGLRALEGEGAAVRSRLLAAATIGETYFFRHHGHFELLADLARERILAARPIRVLSAGCSTGEEAWSAAATILSVVPGQGQGDRLRVEGWDLDERRIAIARRGSYSSWSARRGFYGHDRYFTQVGESWRIAPELRQIAHFRQMNLVADRFPPTRRFDVIFFRNVSIYWRSEIADLVFAKLAALLEDDGIICVGPSDPITVVPPWTARMQAAQRIVQRLPTVESTSGAAQPRASATTSYATPAAPIAPRPITSPRESAAAWPVASAPAASSLSALPAASGPAHPASPPAGKFGGERGVGATPIPDAVRADGVSNPADLTWKSSVAALADAGEYARALDLLAHFADPNSPDAKYWEGVLLLSLDRAQEAANRLRQAVFLDPANQLYRRWFAIGLEAAGRMHEAEREYRNLETLRR
jgi:chemotaxis methyl-accepting protein methylase